jgi:hypothetical protein
MIPPGQIKCVNLPVCLPRMAQIRVWTGSVRSTPLSVPEEVADAVRSEALRQRCRPGEILIDFVRQFWPRYVAEELHRDLCHPASRQVIDAVSEASSNTATAPALAEAATELSPLSEVASSVTAWCDQESEPSGNGPAT